jgi:DNA invertase Pin-like site-specific DNA recombinase
MSTDHQKYSTENQAEVIRQYATRHGFEIVRTYADQGKSGLSIDDRDALKRLIDDVQSGAADFTAVLVYDVSRWGRFQDADESAYYEYICKRAGIAIEYCAEQFENDGSPVSTIVKGVKRAMAGEYSRELSIKVFAGQCRLIELGFRQGGAAGYGLRRVLVDQAGARKGELARGEQKSLQTQSLRRLVAQSRARYCLLTGHTAQRQTGRVEQQIVAVAGPRNTEIDTPRIFVLPLFVVCRAIHSRIVPSSPSRVALSSPGPSAGVRTTRVMRFRIACAASPRSADR